MGDAGKKVGEAVGNVALGILCNLIYGGIKAAQKYGRDAPDPGTVVDAPYPATKPEDTDSQEPEQNPNNAAKPEAEEEVEEKEEEKEEARDITNQQANTARKAAYQAAINAGVTPAQAQAAADAQTPVGNYAGNYAALAGAGANARAAYRERQGYADALERETKNLEEARNREIAAAALSGIGAGASLF